LALLEKLLSAFLGKLGDIVQELRAQKMDTTRLNTRSATAGFSGVLYLHQTWRTCLRFRFGNNAQTNQQRKRGDP